MRLKEKHVHDFKPVTQSVTLHNYVIEKGRIIKDLIAGRDTLKQLRCECGKTETVDLERKIV